MPSHPRPLALGLLQVGGVVAGRRTQARLELALLANVEGYALVETIEVDGSIRDDDAFAVLRDLAQQVDAQVLFTAGSIDPVRVDLLACELRLRIMICKLGGPAGDHGRDAATAT